VQYSPNVAYTLVSIGRLDDEGYTAKFGKGRCVLEGPDGERIGEVLRTKRKAYKVEHEEMANAAEETLTLDRLHRRMGHASTQVIQDLVSQGMVTGIRLEYTPSKVPFFCESCIYGKATRKSVPKLREGERATIFGGEVHSNLWGKSPVESKGAKIIWTHTLTTKLASPTYTSSERRTSNPLRTRDTKPGWGTIWELGSKSSTQIEGENILGVISSCT